MNKIKKGDNVLVISGKYRSKTGKVLAVLPLEEKIKVEGVNIVKKHAKARRQGEKGQIVEIQAPIHISNVKLICPNCKKATRVGFEIAAKSKDAKAQKSRVCKKCSQLING